MVADRHQLSPLDLHEKSCYTNNPAQHNTTQHKRLLKRIHVNVMPTGPVDNQVIIECDCDGAVGQQIPTLQIGSIVLTPSNRPCEVKPFVPWYLCKPMRRNLKDVAGCVLHFLSAINRLRIRVECYYI